MKHTVVNGQNLNLDKTWEHLSSVQRSWICSQFRAEYISCMEYNGRHPGKSQYQEILQNVYDQIRERGIWIPFKEIEKAFLARLPRYRKIEFTITI